MGTVFEVHCTRYVYVFPDITLTPVSSTGQALALSHDGRGDTHLSIRLSYSQMGTVLVIAASSGDVPNVFDDAVTDGHVFVPAVDEHVLVGGQKLELVADAQGH